MATRCSARHELLAHDFTLVKQWIKNYTAFDFRSLGSYTRADLERIAAGPEAF